MKILDYSYVGVQFVLFIAFIILPSQQYDLPTWLISAAGFVSSIGLIIIIIAILQLNKNLSPFPSPKAGGSLITNGLYGIVRHPIYLGILVLCLGYAFYQESTYKLLVTLALAILFHFKADFEERMLTEKFSDYLSYKERTGKIVPFVNF